MKQLNINITKATLKSFSVELQEGKPVINATINLLTEGGQQVTTYSVYTDGWNESNKFELPLSAIAPIVKLAKILEDAVVVKCRDSQLALGSGVPTDPITEQELEVLAIPATTVSETHHRKTIDIVIDTVEDKPIDLSDIPF